MALHQFKTKHYATNGKHKGIVSNSQRMDAGTEQDNYNPTVPQRRSTDPILLYNPSEDGDCCPAQPYKEEEDDLFRSCHNDLIRDMKSNHDVNRSQPRRKHLADDYHYENEGKYSENRAVEMTSGEIHVQSLIRPTQHNRASRRSLTSSGSMRHHELSEISRSQTPHKDNSHQLSDINFYQNPDSPHPPLNEIRSFAYYNSQEPLEVKRLQSFYHQMATHMQSTILCPVTGHQFPMHLLSPPNGVHHPGASLREAALPDVGAFVHAPNYEFENAKRMLVDGVRLVCDGARETMDKMKSKSRLEMGYGGDILGGDILGADYTLTIDESCEDVCEKLNYIQSAFLQLAECNDPEILNEARRIIPADLLHRLLRQVQEHSLEGQDPLGIT